jgi:DNA-binding PadR family transcriptional regulator
MEVEATTARAKDSASMRSPINWALLGLLIERPSYGYELAQRFQQVYGDVMPVSGVSHIYVAIDALKGRSLIEELQATDAPAQPAAARQPKTHYGATAEGVRAYQEQLIAQIGEDHRRSRLLARQLVAFAHEPDVALAIIERYEQGCLREAEDTPVICPDRSPLDAVCELAAHLVEEESRLAIEAKLKWARYARAMFKALGGNQPAGGRLAEG